MPEESTGTNGEPKRQHKRKAKTAAPLIPLPRLQLPHTPGPTLEVNVLPTPTMEERTGLTWIVDTRPRHQLACSMQIKLRTNSQQTGIGRLTQMVTLRKHWATFSITGSQITCNLRVPIPWTRLSALESHAHTKHYHSLPSVPRPHPTFRSLPPFQTDLENPYEFDLWDDEQPNTEASLTRITNATRKNRNRPCKTTAPEPSGGVEEGANLTHQEAVRDTSGRQLEGKERNDSEQTT